MPKPRVAVIAAHPRVDFSEHHTFPDLLDAGYGCLGANLRSLNNDADCLHEKLLIDIAAYMDWLKQRGVEKIVLLGNSGGGSLFAFYQSQAKTGPGERLAFLPDGRPSFLDRTEMMAGDGIVFMAAHAGQGRIMNEVIDPSVIDEGDPLRTDSALDMYDPANGFLEPPAWSRYQPEFVARYRAAQIARVRRIDDMARALIADVVKAGKRRESDEFSSLRPDAQRDIRRREAFEPMMLVYRTMANLHYADNSLDPSPRGYGSLLSPRTDLMNFQRLGFARVVTPQGWLSTWSGLSSNADIAKTGPGVTEPAVVINAGRDLDVYPNTHSRLIFDTIRSVDKQYWNFEDALHYFEAAEGEEGNPTLDALMAKLVPWLEERFPL
ncbi:MAG: alpha/beta hydrolase [Rhodospirillaceae bacterium]|nr:alpha/beta hydrolase [Rhodospirillaceae bacterium]